MQKKVTNGLAEGRGGCVRYGIRPPTSGTAKQDNIETDVMPHSVACRQISDGLNWLGFASRKGATDNGGLINGCGQGEIRLRGGGIGMARLFI